MKTADEIRKITTTNKDKVILKMCEEICTDIEKVALKGETDYCININNKQMAESIVKIFKTQGFTAFTRTIYIPSCYDDIHEVTIAW